MEEAGIREGAGQQGQRPRREHKGQGGARSRMGVAGKTTLSRKKQPLEGQAGLWGRCGSNGGMDRLLADEEAGKNTQREGSGHTPQLTLKGRHMPLTLKQKEGWDGNEVMTRNNEDHSS